MVVSWTNDCKNALIGIVVALSGSGTYATAQEGQGAQVDGTDETEMDHKTIYLPLFLKSL